MGKKFALNQIITWLFMTIMLVIVLYPFLWLILSTFKHEPEFMKYPPVLLSFKYTFIQYKDVWSRIPLMTYLKNTVIFSVGVMVLSVFFDSMAGYAFARLRF